jgi:hypothetical protein
MNTRRTTWVPASCAGWGGPAAFALMRMTPATIALVTLGDALFVVGALGLGGVIALSAPLATLLIAAGVGCNALGILRIVSAGRRG